MSPNGYELRRDGHAIRRYAAEHEALAASPDEGTEIVRRVDGERLYSGSGRAWVLGRLEVA